MQPTTRSRFNRLHVFESKGISTMEVDLLIESLQNTFSNQQIASYCNAGWRSHRGGDSMKTKVSIRDNALKGMASDLLTAMPILYNFVCTFLQDWDSDKVASFKALYAVTAQLQMIKFSGDCSAAATRKLASLVAKHSECFKRAYGSEEVKPKHHYAFQLSEQYFLDGVYVDCYAMERMHALTKAEAELVNDTAATNSEFWVLSKVNRVLCAEADAQNQQPSGQRVIVNGLPAESVHRCASWRGSYGKGHILLVDDAAHIVTECLKFSDKWGLVVKRL